MLHSPNKFLTVFGTQNIICNVGDDCLGHLLWRQDKLLLIISKCSYIENDFIQNSFRFTHDIDLSLEV